MWMIDTSVILFCLFSLVSIAVLMGWIPASLILMKMSRW